MLMFYFIATMMLCLPDGSGWFSFGGASLCIVSGGCRTVVREFAFAIVAVMAEDNAVSM